MQRPVGYRLRGTDDRHRWASPCEAHKPGLKNDSASVRCYSSGQKHKVSSAPKTHSLPTPHPHGPACAPLAAQKYLCKIASRDIWGLHRGNAANCWRSSPVPQQACLQRSTRTIRAPTHPLPRARAARRIWPTRIRKRGEKNIRPPFLLRCSQHRKAVEAEKFGVQIWENVCQDGLEPSAARFTAERSTN